VTVVTKDQEPLIEEEVVKLRQKGAIIPVTTVDNQRAGFCSTISLVPKKESREMLFFPLGLTGTNRLQLDPGCPGTGTHPPRDSGDTAWIHSGFVDRVWVPDRMSGATLTSWIAWSASGPVGSGEGEEPNG
jgi:hypothetical protein